TRAGRCLRLYTAQDFSARPEHEAPEVRRLDLAEPALELHAAGIANLSRFEWFEAPDAHALAAAESLLRRLGAVDEKGQATLTGKRMLRFPLHPRLARMLVEAESRSVATEACVIAALITERNIRAANILLDRRERPSTRASVNSPSDLLELLDLFVEAEHAEFAPARLRALDLDAGATRAVDRVRRQLQRLCAGAATQGRDRRRKELSDSQESELLISILAGYPDRVARRRPGAGEANEGSAELLLAGGGAASLAAESVVRQAEFLVAVDAGERREVARGRRSRGRGGTLVRLASAIEPDWLLDLFADAISETTETEWNAETERVETVRRLVYDQLVLDESRGSEAGSREVTRALEEAALAAGAQAFVEREPVDRLLARVDFMRRTFPEAAFPVLDEDDVSASLALLCEGRRSFAELREAARAGGLLKKLLRKLSPDQARLLAAMAPERVTLASGRQARVNYERQQPPWLASRMQDFFGMKEGLKVAGGRVAVVLHLLAPNQRPVQLTADLAGFWERHYPQARRELSRRYPRHAWPEDPLKPVREENREKRR
ncbi:MAG: ATP-dependent helicase C-terminal domain-containing protein, partial [Pyrinomonadaceae bacterium]